MYEKKDKIQAFFSGCYFTFFTRKIHVLNNSA